MLWALKKKRIGSIAIRFDLMQTLESRGLMRAHLKRNEARLFLDPIRTQTWSICSLNEEKSKRLYAILVSLYFSRSLSLNLSVTLSINAPNHLRKHCNKPSKGIIESVNETN